MKKEIIVVSIPPSVSHSLDERVLAVPALEVDVQLGPHEEVVHGLLVAAPDGVGQGGRAVVRCQVDVQVGNGEQDGDDVSAILGRGRDTEGGVIRKVAFEEKLLKFIQIGQGEEKSDPTEYNLVQEL